MCCYVVLLCYIVLLGLCFALLCYAVLLYSVVPLHCIVVICCVYYGAYANSVCTCVLVVVRQFLKALQLRSSWEGVGCIVAR